MKLTIASTALINIINLR